MKNFQFKLQNLLRLRTQVREQMFQLWANNQRALFQSQREKTVLEIKWKGWQEEIRKNAGTMMLARDFLRERNAGSALERHVQEMEKTCQHLEGRTRQAYQQWQDARRREEALERLKTRSWQEWIREFERQEQKNSDDFSCIQAAREGREKEALERRERREEVAA